MMMIENMLCPSGPGVFTPPQYDTRKPEIVMPEAVILDLKPPTPPQPTRTPPPLPFNPPMWAEIPMNPSDESSSDDETEEIPQYDGFELVHSPKRRRLNSSLSLDVYHFDFPHEEMRMWDFYTNVTCKILSCKNAAGENPWRDALIGRAVESDSLKHALFALTRFHMKRHMQDKEQLQQDKASNMSNLGLQHTNASFQALRREINQGLGGGENNIAAMLVLSFSQVLALVVHSKCRSGMIRRATAVTMSVVPRRFSINICDISIVETNKPHPSFDFFTTLGYILMCYPVYLPERTPTV
jgi:hypothetical protein